MDSGTNCPKCDGHGLLSLYIECPLCEGVGFIEEEVEAMVKCNKCKDKGFTEYHDIDGMTIYRWQKPKRKRCDCVTGRNLGGYFES